MGDSLAGRLRRQSVLRPRFADGREQIEIGIGRLEGRAMAVGAGRDDDVGGRNGDSARPCPPRKRMRRAPDLVVDGELGQGAGKVLEDASFPLPARAVPELELNQRAPARPSVREGRLDAGPNVPIAVRSEQVYPGGSIDEDQRINPGVALPEARPAQ